MPIKEHHPICSHMTVQQAANQWGISVRRVSRLCQDGRILGAEKLSSVWLIPITCEKPSDGRRKEPCNT